MEIYARQGDLVINKLETKFTGEFRSVRNFVLAGSDTSSHVVEGPSMIAVGDNGATIVRVAKKTKLSHGSRHHTVSLAAGDYEIYPLRERGDQTDRVVED